MQIHLNPGVTQTGDYVILVRGQDDVGDGQVCRVLSPDENDPPHVYDDGEPIALLCWTGFVVWSEQDNVIRVEGDRLQLERLFSLGMSRTGSQTIRF